MVQMLEEGRKFGIVDSYWKDIMIEVVSKFLMIVFLYIWVVFDVCFIFYVE